MCGAGTGWLVGQCVNVPLALGLGPDPRNQSNKGMCTFSVEKHTLFFHTMLCIVFLLSKMEEKI